MEATMGFEVSGVVKIMEAAIWGFVLEEWRRQQMLFDNC